MQTAPLDDSFDSDEGGWPDSSLGIEDLGLPPADVGGASLASGDHEINRRFGDVDDRSLDDFFAPAAKSADLFSSPEPKNLNTPRRPGALPTDGVEPQESLFAAASASSSATEDGFEIVSGSVGSSTLAFTEEDQDAAGDSSADPFALLTPTSSRRPSVRALDDVGLLDARSRRPSALDDVGVVSSACCAEDQDDAVEPDFTAPFGSRNGDSKAALKKAASGTHVGDAVFDPGAESGRGLAARSSSEAVSVEQPSVGLFEQPSGFGFGDFDPGFEVSGFMVDPGFDADFGRAGGAPDLVEDARASFFEDPEKTDFSKTGDDFSNTCHQDESAGDRCEDPQQTRAGPSDHVLEDKKTIADSAPPPAACGWAAAHCPPTSGSVQPPNRKPLFPPDVAVTPATSATSATTMTTASTTNTNTIFPTPAPAPVGTFATDFDANFEEFAASFGDDFETTPTTTAKPKASRPKPSAKKAPASTSQTSTTKHAPIVSLFDFADGETVDNVPSSATTTGVTTSTSQAGAKGGKMSSYGQLEDKSTGGQEDGKEELFFDLEAGGYAQGAGGYAGGG
eukprot:g12450.t1